jgi:hypothetical protein
MTTATFAQLCQAQRAAAKSDDGETKSCNLAAAAARKKMNVCAACKGKKQPAELEIIKLENLTMATKRGICDSCREKGLTVSPNHGVLMCSTCKTIHSHVRNRSETVVGAVKRMELVDQYVGDLAGDLVQTTVESLALERIAAAGGYDGKDGDGLIAAVETMAKSRLSIIKAQIRDEDLLEEISEIVGSGPADPEAGFVDLVKDVRDLVEDHLARLEAEPQQPVGGMDCADCAVMEWAPKLAYECGRAVGIDWQCAGKPTAEAIDDVILGVQQTAALLEEAEGEHAENQYELLRLRRIVKLPGSPLREIVNQVEHIVATLDAGSDVDADLVTANNRVDELETTLDQIREAFEGPLPPGVDLEAEVRRLESRVSWTQEYVGQVGAAIGTTGMTIAEVIKQIHDLKALAQYAQPLAMELRTSGRPAESYVLDLAMMVLRGEVTGLDPDFIGAMREAV